MQILLDLSGGAVIGFVIVIVSFWLFGCRLKKLFLDFGDALRGIEDLDWTEPCLARMQVADINSRWGLFEKVFSTSEKFLSFFRCKSYQYEFLAYFSVRRYMQQFIRSALEKQKTIEELNAFLKKIKFGSWEDEDMLIRQLVGTVITDEIEEKLKTSIVS